MWMLWKLSLNTRSSVNVLLTIFIPYNLINTFQEIIRCSFIAKTSSLCGRCVIYLHWLYFQEPVVLSPILRIKCSDDNEDFMNLELLALNTYLDKTPVTAPIDYLLAITTMLSMYWILDVAFPMPINKTLSFLAGHVCKFMPFKVTPGLLKVVNFIYSDWISTDSWF